MRASLCISALLVSCQPASSQTPDAGDTLSVQVLADPSASCFAATTDSLYFLAPSTTWGQCTPAPNSCGQNPDGQLVRDDLATNATTPLFADQVIDGGGPMVVTNDTIFFVAGPYGSALEKVARQGSEPTVADANFDPRWGLVGDGDAAYYVATDINAGTQPVLVRATSSGITNVLSLPNTLFWDSIAVHAGYVYVAADCVVQNLVEWCPDAGVYRAPIATGVLELVASFAPNTDGELLAVNDTTVAWLGTDGHGYPPFTLYSATIGANDTTSRFVSPEKAFGLDVDASSAYVCTDASLHRVDLASGVDTLLVGHTCSWRQVVGSRLWRFDGTTKMIDYIPL